MNFEIFIKGILIGFFSSVPIGPIGLIIMQRTLNKGYKAGFIAGTGAALGDTFFASIAAFSISFIHSFIEQQQQILRIIGGLILIILGIRIFFSNVITQIRTKNSGTKAISLEILKIFFLTLSNPLTIFVFGAVFAGFNIVVKERTYFELIQLIFGVFIGASLWWTILVIVVNLFRKKFKIRQLWWLNKIMGLLISIFGLISLVSTFIIKNL
ncbi:MAG: LysE family translocator [Bacteroidales bacterium]|nr:LysE family translocator [Bacteroidales bacterium]